MPADVDSSNLDISYSASQNGVKATWRRHVKDWADVDALVDSSYGASVTIEGETFTIGYSTLPGRDWMVLSGVEIRFWDNKAGTDDANGLPTCPEGAEVIMEFDTLMYNITGVQPPGGGSEPFYSHNIDSTVQMMTFPQGALQWANDLKPIDRDNQAAFPIVMVNHSFQWHNIFEPPLASMYALAGRINNDTFLGHPAGTVVFDRIGATYTLASDLTRKYTINLGCTARIIQGSAVDGDTITWNHFLRSTGDTNQWVKIQKRVADNEGKTILHDGNFDNLLTLFGYTFPIQRPLTAPS